MIDVDNSTPSVGIIIPIMDRANDLKTSLPSLLNQDYPNYSVNIIDSSSEDELDNVLSEFRLKLIRSPRPEFFNRSQARNLGVRYTFSDLLFFLNADDEFENEHHLSTIVEMFLKGADIDYTWYQDWRKRARYSLLRIRQRPVIKTAYRRVYCHCLGLPLLIDREVFQQLGGYNEAFVDWGFEDTDLLARLELAGFGRIEISGMIEREHSDELRTAYHREKNKIKSWTRNRKISDRFIRRIGPVLVNQTYPGRCQWLEIDGVRYDGAAARQQEWRMTGEALDSRYIYLVDFIWRR